jgi:hypothetical protein
MPKPRGEFVCRDCDQDFETGKDFSDHFKREGFAIVGCKSKAELRAERKAAA